jgi:branched-chain amino acid transport system substrate-binding protein
VADTDMTSQLNKMKAAGVDAVVVWAQGTPTAQLMRSMEKINYFPAVLSSWAADNVTFYDAAGKTLAEKPIFMRTLVGLSTPKQKALFERVGGKLASPSAFPFAVHGYDAVQLIAAAIRQSGGVDGEKMRAALENLNAPVEGAMKTYNKPFSKTQHEALTAADFVFVKWTDGKLAKHGDAVVKSLTASDFKR